MRNRVLNFPRENLHTGQVQGGGVGGVTSSRPQVPCGNMAKSQGQGGGDQQQAPGPVRKYDKVPGAGGLASRRRQVPRGTVAKSQGLGGDQFQSVKTGWG